MTVNTLNQQPVAASLLFTDYLFCWQGSQSPSTRKLPVSGLSVYYAPLTGAAFTGAVSISSGGLQISSGGATITGTSAITGALTVTSGLTISGGGAAIAGAVSMANGLTVSASGAIITGPVIINGNAGVNGTAAFPLRNYIAGLTLSNDGVTPNSILDIAAGFCADSTNAVPIQLTAFTKSTAGTWVSGTGNDGMGTGLTIASSTWYHVFAIVNGLFTDVYFDTSVTAANAPAGTTAFRRIGSFKTDGSANILAFTQVNNEFIWAASVEDVAGDTALSNVQKLYTLASVPSGVRVQARVQVAAGNSAVATFYGVLSPYVTTPAAATIGSPAAAQSGAAQVIVRSNAAQQIGAVSAQAANNIISIFVDGWIDDRGQGA